MTLAAIRKDRILAHLGKSPREIGKIVAIEDGRATPYTAAIVERKLREMWEEGVIEKEMGMPWKHARKAEAA